MQFSQKYDKMTRISQIKAERVNKWEKTLKQFDKTVMLVYNTE